MSELHTEPADDGFNFDERALCVDGDCIGVLDHHGRCKVCGKQGAPARESAGQTAEPSPAAAPETDSFAETDTEDDGDDFADRRLCGDPSCIGVLDAKGRCKECGRQD